MQRGLDLENLAKVEGAEREKTIALIAERVASVINDMPLGAVTTVTEALQNAYTWDYVRIDGEPTDKIGADLYLDTWDMFDLAEAVHCRVRENGIELDSSMWGEEDMGLPWNIQFAIRGSSSAPVDESR